MDVQCEINYFFLFIYLYKKFYRLPNEKQRDMFATDILDDIF